MNHFKELRLKAGYSSQKALADVLFVNQTAVSQWERGVTVPSPGILLKLSQLYGVTTDYLLGNEAGPAGQVPADEPWDTEKREILDEIKDLPLESLRKIRAYIEFEKYKAEQK
ncbi:MAG: helix-turn-helix domain-containing protein [Candidatus Heteroscillospira sp.]|jgi:transcriptional regulator with XRE-family HTH domain